MIFDRLALRLLGWAKALLDESVRPERLRAFLADALIATEAELSSGKESLPPQAEAELRLAGGMAVRLGLLPAVAGRFPTALAAPADDPAADPQALQWAEQWLRQRRAGKATSREGLALGAAAALLAFLEHPSAEAAAFIEGSLESLLRHVETRRRAGLNIAPGAPGADPWMEWLMVGILLARASRQRGDLRLLNAALKLNDWAYPVHRRMRPGPRLARFLLALAEQETAIEGLG